MLKFIVHSISMIIKFFFKSIKALLAFAFGVIADIFFNKKDKDLLSRKEYLKAKYHRAETRINKCIDSLT